MNKKRQRTEIGGDNGFEEWGGYMAAKKNKLQEQYHEQVKKQCQEEASDIFHNVSVFVNGYTVPSADEIKRIMMVHGGIYHHYFSTKHTTHVIASNLPDVKIKQLKSLQINIVKPEWITACLNASRQVDFRPYLLYSHQSRAQPSIRSFAPSTSSSSTTTPNCSVAAENPTGSMEVEKKDGNSNGGEDDQIYSIEQESSEDIFASPENSEMINESKALDNCDLEKQEFQRPGYSKTNQPARCATEPNFLSEFYQNSRLHHISTMGATFKQLVTELRQKNNNCPGVENLIKWKKHNLKAKSSLCEDEDELGGLVDDSFLKSVQPKQSFPSEKIIMHIDMDCFFVSVGLRRYPHLKGQPVAVTHSKGTNPISRSGSDRKFEFNFYKERLEAKLKYKLSSDCSIANRPSSIDDIDETDSMAEIASCSYEAREKGVKNGMFVGAALKLCPDLKVIPYDFEEYERVARTLYLTVGSYTVNIEAVSCDEMLVDCTDLLNHTKCSPIEFATFLRNEIMEKTQCPASTGFGANRLLARLATRKAKPDGIFHLESSMVHQFMESVHVKDLPGVGRALASQLQSMGVTTCRDLQRFSKADLISEMGNKTGELLFGLCRGQDDRSLNFEHQRKSVSAEVNYGIRFKNQQEADIFVRQLSLEVQSRLIEAKKKGSCITLKLLVRAKDAPKETAKFMGHGVCDSMSKSCKLPRATSDGDTIAEEVLLIMKKLNVDPSDLRGIGIQITQLESSSNSAAGAMDRFVMKNVDSSISTSNITSKPPCKQLGIENSPKKANLLMPLSKKGKVPQLKGTLGIDQYMVARKKTTRNDNICKLPAHSDLDAQVLGALPEEIRKEILEAYSLGGETEPLPAAVRNTNSEKEKTKMVSHNTIDDVSYSQVDPTFLEALPSEMRKELEADFHRQRVHKDQRKLVAADSSENCNLVHLSKKTYCVKEKSILSCFLKKPHEIKDLLRQWMAKETEPHVSDIHILEHYLCDLVHEKSIENLHVILKFFFRCVHNHPNSLWKEKFQDIMGAVQARMYQVYNAYLNVEGVEL